MDDTLKAMLDKYASSLAGSEYVANAYVKEAMKFLEYSGGDLSKKRVEDYMRKLRTDGYADGTIRKVFGIIRRLYRVNGVEWPFRRSEGPVVRELEVFAPALSNDVIKAMIVAATSGALDELESAFLAISTTYGPRRTEMSSLTRERIDIANRLIYFETAKYGRQRWHIIPDEIVPYLERCTFKRIPSSTLTKIYHRIESKVGLPNMYEVGWHAIRRALNRNLVHAGLPEPVIMNFLRWKRSTMNMVSLYHSTTVIGIDGRVTDIAITDREVDMQVFAVHPFLPMWGGGDSAQTEAV